jgi:hypothetical protein
VLRDLCLNLLSSGHEVHIITGVFPEALHWQDAPAKRRKLKRLGIPFKEQAGQIVFVPTTSGPTVELHVLEAVPQTFDRNYRLADLGLRKGVLCEELGITLFYEDSELYAEMIPKMSGNTLVLLIR